jgi:hypothetical protein
MCAALRPGFDAAVSSGLSAGEIVGIVVGIISSIAIVLAIIGMDLQGCLASHCMVHPRSLDYI